MRYAIVEFKGMCFTVPLDITIGIFKALFGDEAEIIAYTKEKVE